MHAVIGATEEHNLTKLLRCFYVLTLLKLRQCFIKPVAVSRLYFKNKETKLYGLCIDG